MFLLHVVPLRMLLHHSPTNSHFKTFMSTEKVLQINSLRSSPGFECRSLRFSCGTSLIRSHVLKCLLICFTFLFKFILFGEDRIFLCSCDRSIGESSVYSVCKLCLHFLVMFNPQLTEYGVNFG